MEIKKPGSTIGKNIAGKVAGKSAEGPVIKKPGAPAAKPALAPAPEKKAVDLEAVAKDVIRGAYGNGEERKQKLAAAGYDFDEVQKVVNKLLG